MLVNKRRPLFVSFAYASVHSVVVPVSQRAHGSAVLCDQLHQRPVLLCADLASGWEFRLINIHGVGWGSPGNFKLGLALVAEQVVQRSHSFDFTKPLEGFLSDVMQGRSDDSRIGRPTLSFGTILLGSLGRRGGISLSTEKIKKIRLFECGMLTAWLCSPPRSFIVDFFLHSLFLSLLLFDELEQLLSRAAFKQLQAADLTWSSERLLWPFCEQPLRWPSSS